MTHDAAQAESPRRLSRTPSFGSPSAHHLAAAMVALVWAGCGTPEPEESAPPPGPSPAASVPFEDTWWRLESLGGNAPVDGVRPVLIFTTDRADRDTYDRPYPDSLRDWRIGTGDLGVGRLHAPYLRAGDTLHFADLYDRTRVSTEAEQRQAERLADALRQTRTATADGGRLTLHDALGEPLAAFAADPTPSPGPLSGTEWVLTYLGAALDDAPQYDLPGRNVPGGVRATLTFTDERLGPGPRDGFFVFRGSTGCNSYGGGYRMSPGQAPGQYVVETAGPPESTLQGCPDPEAGVERAVLRGLSRMAEVRADSLPGADGPRSLSLHDADGASLLVFERRRP